MKYGVILLGKDQEIVAMAQEAEAAGWDGIFLPDDWGASWIRLTAIAMSTTRLRLGTMLTPLPLHHPWTIAAQTATLDQLSHGRLLLAVGLGVLDLDKVGLQDNTTRAQMLDESVEILTAWWSGAALADLTYQGHYYHLEKMKASVPWLTHRPMQQPRIPIWVVGGEKPSQIRRASRWDGALMQGTPEEIHHRKSLIQEQRKDDLPFDIITEGSTPGNDLARAAATVQPYAEAGVTWWIESMWEQPKDGPDVLTRIKMGPPHLA